MPSKTVGARDGAVGAPKDGFTAFFEGIDAIPTRATPLELDHQTQR